MSNDLDKHERGLLNYYSNKIIYGLGEACIFATFGGLVGVTTLNYLNNRSYAETSYEKEEKKDDKSLEFGDFFSKLSKGSLEDKMNNTKEMLFPSIKYVASWESGSKMGLLTYVFFIGKRKLKKINKKAQDNNPVQLP